MQLIEGVCWFLLLPCLLSQKIDGSIFSHPWLDQWITPKCIAMTCSWLQCTCHGSVLFIIHVLQCTCAQSPWLWFIHYTCATVYMCSASMTVVYSLYMCYSVHVLSLHDCGLFIIHVLQCTCATVYMCYSVHVFSLHGCVLFIVFSFHGRHDSDR